MKHLLSVFILLVSLVLPLKAHQANRRVHFQQVNDDNRNNRRNIVIAQLQELIERDNRIKLAALYRNAHTNPQGFVIQDGAINTEQVAVIKTVLRKNLDGSFYLARR